MIETHPEKRLIGLVEEIRNTLVEVANIDDFLEDLDAAERTLRLYLAT